MNDKTKLLNEISAVGFALIDINLFLDTHPNCKEALQYRQQAAKKKKMLTERYEAQFGPLTIAACGSENCWEWVSNPWPWDYEGGIC